MNQRRGHRLCSINNALLEQVLRCPSQQSRRNYQDDRPALFRRGRKSLKAPPRGWDNVYGEVGKNGGKDISPGGRPGRDCAEKTGQE